jgi:hypothetical protein
MLQYIHWKRGGGPGQASQGPVLESTKPYQAETPLAHVLSQVGTHRWDCKAYSTVGGWGKAWFKEVKFFFQAPSVSAIQNQLRPPVSVMLVSPF